MDPDNCDAWEPDSLVQRNAKRKRLVQHLNGVWKLKEHGTIRRYNDEEVDTVVYNGWALWEVDNPDAPFFQ